MSTEKDVKKSTEKDVNGSGKNGVNRRDFLKIGGLTALALTAATVIERVGDSEIISSPDEYGGFYIRRHSKQNPPYQVDDTIYKRMDPSRGAGPLSNMLLVVSGNSKLSKTRAEHILHGKRGQDRLAYAFESGAGTFMMDTSFYSWEPVNNNILNDRDWPKTRWDRVEAGYSQEEVNQIIKTAARLYGASLVGITELDERWFYSRVASMPGGMSPGNLPTDGMDPTTMLPTSPGNLPPTEGGGVDPTMLQQMLPTLLNTMEPEQLKALLLKAFNSMDPASLPAGVNPQMLEAVSPEMIKNMVLPKLVQDMDPAIAQAIIQNLDPSQVMGMSTPTPTPTAGQGMPLNEIVFSDEVDAPQIQDGKQVIPRSMNRIIVMAFEMDSEALSMEPGPLMLAGVGNAYSRMAFTAACMAKFIRALGYHAIPMGNDTALSMPMAVDAGLGEIGRNGLMITPKYGPRVRLAKVLTDLPLEIDGPITFGVTEFCENCGKCAKTCPSQSISHSDRTYESPATGNPGFYHWPVDGATCYMFWETLGTDCNICIASCPFNKPQGWLHDATKILIGAKSGPLDKLLLNLDDAAGFGEIKSLDASWDIYLKKDNFIHIKP